jgi:hypothetical protein
MLIPFLAIAMSALAQSAPIQTVAASRHDGPAHQQRPDADSLRALKSARRAQESFELVRRQYLPRDFGVGNHHCDVRIGRWCVWNDETNDRKPPPESPRIKEARDKLLAVLDDVGSRFPGDEWVAAQLVRYLIEARRYGDAVRVANRCTESGSAYRCRAWAGVALHDSGAVAAADSAFSAALAAMADSARCRWTDISLLLDDDIADRYAKADCTGRRPIESSFWRLTNPLYLRDHDFHNEYMARVARGEMERDSRTPMGSPTESAFYETTLRYGYDSWFVRDDAPAGWMQEAAIAGYREGGSGFNFLPSSEAFNSPADLRTRDWDFKLKTARTMYGPSYARHFRSLAGQQISLFRRGDSVLIVAAYDVRGDTLFETHGLEAGLFAVPVDSRALGAPRGTVTTDAPPSGIVSTTAPRGPLIVSLELLDTKTKSAARARFGLRPPPSVGRVGISDLVMFAPRSADSMPHRLEDALPLVLRTDRIGRTSRLGLFWETYGVRAEGETFAVSITIERIEEGWMRRTAERLHLATPFSPMTLQWMEVPDHVNGVASRSVTLDLSQLTPGRYEIRLSVSPTDGLPMVAKREVTVDR